MIKAGKSTTGYIIRICASDLDLEKMSLTEPVLCKDYENKFERIKKLGGSLDKIFLDYLGITSNLEDRIKRHLLKKTEPFFYSKNKEKTKLIHKETLGFYIPEETEKLERLLLETRNEFYLKLWLDQKIFVIPFGPRVEKIGEQKTHPYPDSELMPKWYRDFKITQKFIEEEKKREAEIAALNPTVIL